MDLMLWYAISNDRAMLNSLLKLSSFRLRQLALRKLLMTQSTMFDGEESF